MYDYHYVNINNKHGIKINHYLLTQLGLFKTLKLNICVNKDKAMFEFSEYSKDSKFYNDSNRNVIGKMKNKTKRYRNFKVCGIKIKDLSFHKIWSQW